jgi:Thaumatin family
MGSRRRRVVTTQRAAMVFAAISVVLLLGAAGLFTRPSGASPTGTAWVVPSVVASVPSAQSPAAPSPAAASPSAPPSATPGRSTSARPSTVGPAHSTTPGAVPPGGARQVTFVNAVNQTIWVAAWQQTPQPALPVTGWVLPAGQNLTITVPDHWNGRFWGRTGCSFDASGHGHCQTGDCAGKFQCTQYGEIPATLAEYNLNSWQNLDFYDVSLVDGSNLPMFININYGSTKDPINANGCSSAGCTKAVPCPAELTVTAGGATVGCISPCAKFNTDQYCCRGPWASRAACDPTKWPVNYAAIFKAAEPFAYSYVDDDATSTFTCAGECGYRITFGLSR